MSQLAEYSITNAYGLASTVALEYTLLKKIKGTC